ncbi:MAG: YcaO-like family protein [Halobacteriaceae archaeon]
MSTDAGREPLVGVVGEGPAIEAARAALADVAVRLEPRDATNVADCRLVVAAGLADGGSLVETNRAAVAAGIPLVVVEVGGLGGTPVEGPGIVGVLGPTGPCYTCLRERAAGTAEETVSEPTATPSGVRYAGATAGYLAIQHLGEADLTGRVVVLPEDRHQLLAVPHCPTCAPDRDWSLDLTETSELDTAAAAAAAEGAVDERLGPVEVVGERESYPAPYYLARLAPTDRISDGQPRREAAGVAAGWDAAYMKALGEAMERYSAGVYRTADLIEAPADALPNPVPPDEFVLPRDVSVPDSETPVRWVPGVDLESQTAVSLPADRTLFPPPGDGLGNPITTGLGLGTSVTDAVLAGLTEVLERDATMLAWYSTYDPMGLAVEDDEYAALARRANSESLSVTATLLTQDIDIPVVAVAVHRDSWPRFAAGSAAGLDAEAAARNALSEALQNWMELRALGRADAADAGPAVARYADDPDQVRELIEPAPTLPAGDVGPRDPPTGRTAVRTLVDRVSAAGVAAYAARLTARDVAALGFEAVRVLVPGAQPLFVDEPVFGDRARTVPEELGYEPRVDRASHPFP